MEEIKNEENEDNLIGDAGEAESNEKNEQNEENEQKEKNVENEQKEKNVEIEENDQKFPSPPNETIWLVLSILSWFLLICVQIESIINSYFSQSNEINIIKSLKAYKIFILIFSIIGLIVYLVYTTCKKDENLYNRMLGSYVKLHFISLLFAAALFMIEQYNEVSVFKQGKFTNLNTKNYNNGIDIADLVVAFVLLILLYSFYGTMNLRCNWYISFCIRKGTYSSLISYSIYKILSDIYNIIDNNVDLSKNNLSALVLIPVFLIGFLALILSLICKDIILTFATCIIYIGYLVVFSITILLEDYTTYSKIVMIFLDVIAALIIVLSFLLIALLSAKYKDKIFK